MLVSDFDQILYPDSPFLPPVTVQTALAIAHLVTIEAYPPAIAIASTLRDHFGEHIQFLDSEMAWITEKFGISRDDVDEYYFGLLVPSTLMIAAHMSRYNHMDVVVDSYFPLPDNSQFFLDLRNYGIRHIPLVSGLLQLDLPDPLISAEPVFRHCQFEVLSFKHWYQIGLKAGEHTFRQFAQLY